MANRWERGSTFIGQLVALAIVGGALALLMGTFAPSGMGVAVVRQRVTAENYARKQMEAIKAAPYQPNPTVQPYPTVEMSSNYGVNIEVSYWVSDTQTFVSTVNDDGLQRITVEVYATERPNEALVTLEDYKGVR